MTGSYSVRLPNHPKMRTPWGSADAVYQRAPGILAVSTPGHGGFKLDRKANAKIPQLFRRAGGWYEEDCEWAIVALFFKDSAGFDDSAVKDATCTVKTYWPDQYSAHYNVTVTPEESSTLRDRIAKQEAKGKLVVTSCWGSWSKNVPKGMVGVYARVGGHESRPDDGAKEGYFLLTESEYNSLQGSVTWRTLPDTAQPVTEWEPAGSSCPFGASK